jgi:hypothetical protein
MAYSKAKLVSTAAGIGVVAVIGFSLVYWKDLLAHYNLIQLQNKPERIREFLAAAEGTPKSLALVRYIKTREGSDAVFSIYLSAFKAELKDVLSSIDRSSSFCGAIVVMNHTNGGFYEINVFSLSNRKCAQNGGNLFPSDNKCFLMPLNRFVAHLPGYKHSSKQFPDLEFSFIRGDLACKRTGFCPISGHHFNPVESPPELLAEILTDDALKTMSQAASLYFEPIAREQKPECQNLK